ncbi:MAG: hypothetical protein VXY89_14505, partial [SAR324 cluster bacterium]|nr:hypothetical protein [SAR324 cluster bacterium]
NYHEIPYIREMTLPKLGCWLCKFTRSSKQTDRFIHMAPTIKSSMLMVICTKPLFVSMLNLNREK